MKDCNSSMVIVCVLFFSLFLILSQIKLSSVSRPTRSDQGPHMASRGDSPFASPINCDRSHQHYEICSTNGPTVLDSTKSTFYFVGPTNSTGLVEKVRPYPGRNSTITMSRIKEVTLTSGPPSPPCMVQHNARALVFSVGGFTKNFFHAFVDVFIPLFITVNSISPADQDLVLVITNAADWWVPKYGDLFRSFSKHPIINLDNDTSTHCFASATVGLISHGFMTVDPNMLPNSKTILHFHELLDKTYCHDHPTISLSPSLKLRPRLVLMGRSGGVGRVILNQAEVKKMAEEVGFEVIEFEPKQSTPLREAWTLISSSHAMLGVHGAALTYALFLRPHRSVLVQVVAVGLDIVAELCFGKAAREMGLEYMEYKIGLEESSLIDRYGKEDEIVKDPKALKIEWYDNIIGVYLRQQNVKLDVVRFRGYLKKAYEKAKILMLKGG